MRFPASWIWIFRDWYMPSGKMSTAVSLFLTTGTANRISSSNFSAASSSRLS